MSKPGHDLRPLTLAEAAEVANAYSAKEDALEPLRQENGILYLRERKKLEPEAPSVLLAGKVVIWPFRVTSISEHLVELLARSTATERKASYDTWNDHSGFIRLAGGRNLYWKVGCDLTLIEAEKLRNGQIFQIQIRLIAPAPGDLNHSGAFEWSWDFIDYPTGKDKSRRSETEEDEGIRKAESPRWWRFWK